MRREALPLTCRFAFFSLSFTSSVLPCSSASSSSSCAMRASRRRFSSNARALGSGGRGERGRARAGNPSPARSSPGGTHRAHAGSPFAAAVGYLVSQLVPLLLGLALGTFGSRQVLPREPGM